MIRLTHHWSQRRLRRSVFASDFGLAEVTGGVAQFLVVRCQHDTFMFSSLKNLFTKSTPPEFHDSELGVLKLDCGTVWGGTVQQDGRELRFWIGGTGTAPDAALLASARRLLARFPDTERSAVEFLRSRETELRQARLDFSSFQFIWEARPDDFALEFLANQDDSGVWRVEFVDGQPSQTGYED